MSCSRGRMWTYVSYAARREASGDRDKRVSYSIRPRLLSSRSLPPSNVRVGYPYPLRSLLVGSADERDEGEEIGKSSASAQRDRMTKEGIAGQAFELAGGCTAGAVPNVDKDRVTGFLGPGPRLIVLSRFLRDYRVFCDS